MAYLPFVLGLRVEERVDGFTEQRLDTLSGQLGHGRLEPLFAAFEARVAEHLQLLAHP